MSETTTQLYFTHRLYKRMFFQCCWYHAIDLHCPRSEVNGSILLTVILVSSTVKRSFQWGPLTYFLVACAYALSIRCVPYTKFLASMLRPFRFLQPSRHRCLILFYFWILTGLAIGELHSFNHQRGLNIGPNVNKASTVVSYVIHQLTWLEDRISH